MNRRPFRKGDIVCWKGSDRLYTVMEDEKKIGRSYFFKFFLIQVSRTATHASAIIAWYAL